MCRSVFVIFLLLGLVACPRPRRHTLVPSVPTSGDAGARQRFLEARERFLRDGSGQEEFADIAREFPDDPIAPFANLYAGVAAVGNGDHTAAIATLQQVVDTENADPGLVTRAQLFLGVAHNADGDPARALPLLARGEKAIENDAERGLWIAATAAATAAVAPGDAAPWLERYWGVATEAEQGWILATLEGVVAALDTANDPGVAEARATLSRLREKLGVPPAAGEPARADDVATPGQLGAVLPLGGKQVRVGDAAARGLAIAAGAHGGASVATVDLADARDAETAAAAVSELAAGGAIGIVGPIDGDSVDAAAARAEELGLPLVSLNPRADERPTAGRHVFHAMHSAEQRARILARRAKAAGLDRFAILAPDSGYGKAVAGAFAEQVGAQGGTVVVRVDYARDAKSFAKEVKKLDGKWQAVFVPEQADRLELIAPALAAAGLVPRPPGGKVGKKQGRAIVLLSTAEGMGADYVRDAGRHSVGALLAPGFYPDAGDPTIGAFVERYQAAHGRLPEVVDAYAHDAALAIAVAAGREASRSAVTRYLEAVEVEGATGTVKFGKDHRRSDDGVVFTVEDDGVTVKTLR
jgi:ABC-type branched-subunit amino acid transport system substrate-binding protein